MLLSHPLRSFILLLFFLTNTICSSQKNSVQKKLITVINLSQEYDKMKKIDHEVKKIHTHIKKANLVLRQRIKDIQEEMEEWDCLGEFKDDKSNGNWFMRKS